MKTPPLLDIYQPQAILNHVKHTLDFYTPRAQDKTGGFYHFFKDDGTIFDHHTRHLVSSTRFVFVWAMAARHFVGTPSAARYLEFTRHGVTFLRQAHFQNGYYAWQLDWPSGKVLDPTQHAYGHAFVFLAFAHALQAGVSEAKEWLYEVYQFLETRFWQPNDQLYADEATAAGQCLPYRGQNANMHMVEACLAAYDATHDLQFLTRAQTVAQRIVCDLPTQTDGLMIWEHYDQQWRVDWDYNKGDMRNIFRPWGYQPGHFTEWAKLLIGLERRLNAATPDSAPFWLLTKAEALFERAMTHAWDEAHGGLYYGFGPDYTICDARKYHWVQCETMATAAVLGTRTDKASYWTWYEKLWAYSWQHWIDHQHGAWFRLLSRENINTTDEKSPAGKVDYHTTGACYDILAALAQRKG